MNYRDWLTLSVLGKEKNLTKASKKLYLSQPALSFRLKSIEKDLGIPIVIRHAKGIDFTPEGIFLVQCAEEELKRQELIRKKLKKITLENTRKVKVAISTTIAKYHLGTLLTNFSNQYPCIEIEVITELSPKIPQLLINEQVDIGISRGAVEWSEQKFLLDQESWGIFSKKKMEKTQLIEKKWFQHKDALITKSLDFQYRWWKDNFGKALPQIIMVDSIEACLEMVAYGLGWTILPEVHQRKRKLSFSPIQDTSGKTLQLETWLFIKEKKSKKEAVRFFMEYLLGSYAQK